MKRGKLSPKLISAPKSRTTTFHTRKKSLMKKAYELSTLCDVRTCVLIHGPAPALHDDDRSYVEFHTWPPNRNEIEGMIRAYKNNKQIKRSDLNDFFSDRKGKIETETSKLRKDVEQIKYPKWDERLDRLSEDQLRMFMDGLCSKIEVADGMIEFMEGDYDHLIGDGAENSTIDSESPLLQTDESPQIQIQILAGSSVPMMPIEESDFSDFLLGQDGDQCTYDHLQSLFDCDEMIMEDNNTATFHSIVPLQSVHDSFDYSDFEYLMATDF